MQPTEARLQLGSVPDQKLVEWEKETHQATQ
jgi:hypothetical protein